MLNRVLFISYLITATFAADLSFAATESEPDKSCALMLLSSSATQGIAGEKSVVEKVFGALPLSVRGALARTSSQALAMHEKTLQERIAELIPPEVTSQMAAMFQTSHDYLMGWLPVLPQSVRLGEKRYNKSEFENLGLDYFINEAQKTTWAPRLKEAHKLLLELVKLQEARHANPSELASSYLRLALLYSYCYGFQGYLVGRRSPEDLVLDDSKGALTVSGLEYFRRAIEIYESQLGPQHEGILTLKYLMLRHANNGILAHNNSQYRTFDWQRVQPDPIMSEFVEAAKKLSTELWHELGSDPAPTTFGPRRVLFYYVSRELQKSTYYVQIPHEDGSLFAESPSGRTFQGRALDLLLLIAKEAPKVWIDDQLNDPHRKKFLSNLISDSRWYVQTELRHPGWELMHDVQLHPEKHNYESLLAILNELGLFKPAQKTTTVKMIK